MIRVLARKAHDIFVEVYGDATLRDWLKSLAPSVNIFANATLIFAAGGFGAWVSEYWLEITRGFWHYIFNNTFDLALSAPFFDGLTLITFLSPIFYTALRIREKYEDIGSEDFYRRISFLFVLVAVYALSPEFYSTLKDVVVSGGGRTLSFVWNVVYTICYYAILPFFAIVFFLRVVTALFDLDDHDYGRVWYPPSPSVPPHSPKTLWLLGAFTFVVILALFVDFISVLIPGLSRGYYSILSSYVISFWIIPIMFIIHLPTTLLRRRIRERELFIEARQREQGNSILNVESPVTPMTEFEIRRQAYMLSKKTTFNYYKLCIYIFILCVFAIQVSGEVSLGQSILNIIALAMLATIKVRAPMLMSRIAGITLFFIVSILGMDAILALKEFVESTELPPSMQ